MAQIPKLRYFDAWGRGDMIRMVLTISKVEFEDIAMPDKEFYEVKPTGLLPFKQVPTLEMEGETFFQTRAIVSMLCANQGWMPKTPQQIYLDSWYWDSIDDLYVPFCEKYMFAKEEKKQEGKEKYVNDVLPMYFKAFEEKFVANGGSETGYLVGDNFTPGMFWVISCLHTLFQEGDRKEDFWPLLEKYAPQFTKMMEHQKKNQLAEFYQEKRRVYTWPF